MSFNKFKLAIFTSIVVAIIVFSVSAQKSTDFNRVQTFDAQHYIVRVSFDSAKKKVFGDTTVVLKPLNANFKTIELDAVDLDFESVSLEPVGTSLKFRTSDGKVIVTLDRDYSPGETIAIRLKYSAVPSKGVYFIDSETAEKRVEHSNQIWTQGEPDEARHWFPSFDFPSDKATTEEYITAEKSETVIGNGELIGKEETAGGKQIWHYKMSVPHSTYLVSFVIGEYARIDDKYKDIPLSFYTYPGKEQTARKAFGSTKDMIAVFEKATGIAFPYNKYDQTVVAKFKYGGMENITATTMADSEIFFADFDFGKAVVDDLVSHELAHSWFGDLVTCRNWAELWLNEGFATYMEAIYLEQTQGRAAYLRKIQNDADEFLADDATTKRRYGLYNLRAGEVDKLFDVSAVTYSKGSVVLHMLREQVGTEVFWRAVNNYLNKHKFANVETSDLRAAMEKESGRDLGWFFDQWIYHSGAPRLTVTSNYSARTKLLKITVNQTQKADAVVPAAFQLPITFAIKTEEGMESTARKIQKRVETYSIKLDSKPVGIGVSPTTYNPEDKVPAKLVKILPIIYGK